MGCGCSKGTQVVNPGSSVHSAYGTTAKFTYVRNDQGQENNYAWGNGDQTYQRVKTTYEEQGSLSASNLPPPRPPTQTREELLAGKHDMMKRMDQHAIGISSEEAVRQNLDEFTVKTLMPESSMVTTQTVQITESSKITVDSKAHDSEGKHATQETSTQENMAVDNSIPDNIRLTPKSRNAAKHETSNGPADPSKPPPRSLDSMTRGFDSVDAAELLLEKYKKDTERQKNLMEVDKMRQNVSLKDKLAKRRELKKRALEQKTAQTAQSARSEGISDVIEKKHHKIEEITPTETGEVSMTDFSDITLAPEITVAAQGAIDPRDQTGSVGQVAAVQDKYSVVMAETAPAPVAPATNKEAIYGNEDNIELFKDLEDFAVNMKQIDSAETTFALLMNSLLIDQLSDLEKVRILFHWITKQDLNAINFPDNIPEDTPMGFLSQIKNDRKNYCDLFSRLCSAAGLHSKVIRGYAKGVGYLPDYKFVGDGFRGSWNAVFIDGQWRLIDTNWGARHIVEDDTDVTFEKQTVYKYEEHYFLTNPDQLIITHFPEEKDWQLLRQPITLEQFEDTVRLWPLFHKLKLTIESPLKGVVTAAPNGVTEIRIRMPEFARRDAELSCKLMTKIKKREINDINLDLCTFHYSDNDLQIFRIFCPAVGEYLLRIYGSSKRFHDQGNTCIALYQINCPKLKKMKMQTRDPLDVKPHEIQGPLPESHQQWGPPRMHGNTEFLPLTHAGPIVCCDKKGEASVILGVVASEKVSFLQDMYNADGRLNSEKKSLPDRAINFSCVSNTRQKIVVFRVRTPANGIFSLNLFAKHPSDDQYQKLGNYLVVSQAQSHDSPPFPSVPNGALGEVQDHWHSLNILPTFHPQYAIKDTEKHLSGVGYPWMGGNDSESYVIFEHKQPLNIIAKIGGDEASFKGNVLIQCTGCKTLIVVRPPKETKKTSEVVLQLYASPAEQLHNLPCILNAFVSCGQIEPKWLPVSPVNKWGPCGASQSIYRLLTSVSNTTSLFDTPRFHDQDENITPCRLFSGGDHVDVKFALKSSMALNAVLSTVDKTGTNQKLTSDKVLLLENSQKGATFRLSIPDSGNYSFMLYGSSDTNSNQFSRLYCILIEAKRPSNGVLLPRSFGIWMSSYSRLHSPLSKDLKRNVPAKIIVTLAEFTEHGGLTPFPSVLLFTDQSTTINPSRTDASSFTYEWDYVPGPGEKQLGVVIQRSLQDNSLATALQFDIVD